MAKTLPKRDEVPEEVTWDVRSVFASDADWEAAMRAANEAIPGLERFRGKLGESGSRLLEALETRDALLNDIAKISLYAGMQAAGDTTNQTYLARNEQADSLQARAAGAGAYFEPEILALDPARLKAIAAEEPGLAPYGHYFDRLQRQREHVRSPEVESILAEVSDVTFSPYRIHVALEDADLKFATIKDEEGNDVQVQQGNVEPLIRSQDRNVRKAAWEAYADGYIGVKNTMAATLAGAVKSDVFYARARNYPSALRASLGPFEIPVQVFDNLLETFRRHLPLWHRYWDIRRRALGVDKLHGYDIDVPLVRVQRRIAYEEAIDTICEGMSPLGEEYIEPMRKGLVEQRWVDIYPNQGKGSGAFSSGVPGTHPFLMLNYDDTLENLSTLAHELGHSMHSYFSWKHQPFVYSQYSMFVAETASNFNQAMVRAHLLSTHDDRDFQLEVLAEAMSNFHRYLFIMPTLARFELDCHQRVERGEGLVADEMSAKLVELFREAYGPEVEIDEERVGITWAQFPHMFGNFYVFQYATGISAANALADSVLRDGKAAASRYLDFLKAGDSLYPIDALRLAGIDMAEPEPVERGFGVLSRLIDRLDELVGAGPVRAS
jgi:oligoendopeptidase F